MSPAARDVSSRETRVDIQWMRGLAVGLVLLYHFWPNRVQGGFIGVDIFFVISGFLITTHLLDHPPQRFYDLVVFWGRRVRRLLPAAFTVILITLAGVWLFAPTTQWMDNARSAITAGLYVENWNLASQAVDYLAAANPPTALQHYWSLSVEEQFYLIWPIIIGVIGLIVRKHIDRFRQAAIIGLGIVVVASLAWSIYYTSTNPAAAYFVTPTRMWELGAGGVLAATYPAINTKLKQWPVLQVSLVATGVVMIGFSALCVTGTNFPGWIAVIPILGALIVIGTGPADYKVSFDRVLKWRPFQLLGDISYSVYLWHWPIVVLLPLALGHVLSWKWKLVAIAATLIISWASKTFIEDKFRGQHPLGQPLRRTFIFLLAGMLTISATGAVFWATTDNDTTVPSIDTTAPCVGAHMLLDPQCQGQRVHGPKLLITPLQAMHDSSITHNPKDLQCRWEKTAINTFPICVFGSDSKDAVPVALLGNSHANPYIDPLISVADTHNWSIRTYLASSCEPSLTLLHLFHTAAENQSCLKFTQSAIADMKQHGTQLVIISVRSSGQATIETNTELLNSLVSSGMHVLVIHDVPMPVDVPNCVAAHPHNLSACDGPRNERIVQDPLYDAAVALNSPYVHTADFTDALCDATTCYGVIGGVIAYYNAGHLTGTFAMSLLPQFEAATVATLTG